MIAGWAEGASVEDWGCSQIFSKLEIDLDPELDTTSRPVNVNHYCPFDLETSFFSIMKMCSFLIGKRRDELRNVIIFNGH